MLISVCFCLPISLCEAPPSFRLHREHVAHKQFHRPGPAIQTPGKTL